VRPGTAQDLRWLMWLTVEKGTGTQARQAAYMVGGKTGTADKPKEGGRGYQQGVVIASFAGVFPIEDPRYVVLAMLDEPRGDKSTHGYRYGGWTAAPVVGNVIDRIGPLLGVGPSAPESRRPFADRLQVTHEGKREERLAAVGPSR
jgi:cell division protein FtsI (penicillin-binding protein 3)